MTDFITLDDLKAHLNILDDADDALLADKITAASEYVEQWIVPIEDGAPVPDPIKEATRKLAADFYERRGSSDNQPSIAVEFDLFYMILPYRSFAF